METTHAALLLLAPAAAHLLAALHGCARRDESIAAVRRAARLTHVVAIAAAVAALGHQLILGAASSPLLGAAGIGLSARLDPLSVALVLLVSIVGAVVLGYARRYLDGDPDQRRFHIHVHGTLAAVLAMVAAGNLVQLLLAWIATSLVLHRLLLFRPARPGAQRAARKKFVVARTGDMLLASAVGALIIAFGTTDIAELGRAARAVAAGDALPSLVPLAVGCMALAALLKSAAFPSHGWLLDVMETPTPVSALLHAGVVNAGGFLLLRFTDLLLLEPGIMAGIAAAGGLTAVVGVAAMLTQPAIKLSLAWSTVAQMGFMMLQIGVGAFAAALVHLVAHSLYKSHAFLASGGAVEAAASGWRMPVEAAPSFGAVAGACLTIVTLAALSLGLATAFGATPAISGLAVILALGTWLVLTDRAPLGARLVVTGGVLALWLSVHAGGAAWAGEALTAPATTHPATIAALAATALLLGALTLLQNLGVPAGARWQRLRVHLAAGLYASALLDRLVGARRHRGPRQHA